MGLFKNKKSIQTDEGFRVYYFLNHNKNSKNKFIFLHPGGSMNHTSLNAIEQFYFDNGFSTIGIDPRGFGLSEAEPIPQFFTLDRFSSDIEKILIKEGIEKPHFLGKSYGFMTIIDYVAKTDNAEHITGICASHKFSETAQNKFLYYLFTNYIGNIEYFGSAFNKIKHKLKNQKRGYAFQDKQENKSELAVWLSIVNVPFERIVVHKVCGKKIFRYDITEQLKNIEQEMLLIYGKNDMMVKPYAGERISQLSPGKTDIEVINGQHSIAITQPNDVIKILQQYYSKKGFIKEFNL